MKDVGDADVQSYFDLFRKVLDEVCESFGDEKENLISKSLVSIKSLMSDRCATLHYLVGLADQAYLKVWERILFKGQKVGSLCQGGYSNGKSGVTRLIWTVCKSVQEQGCEKSGQVVSVAV